MDLNLIDLLESGRDNGRGNLLGVQPMLSTSDYASAEAFCARLGAYLRAAKEKGWVNERTVVVWPEHVGTWLVAAGEGTRVLEAPTIRAAMGAVIRRQALPFLRAYAVSRERDRATAAVFRLKATTMATCYQDVFSGLARDHGVTVVAGSIVLPAPVVKDGAVEAGRGLLFNAAVVFGPDGRAHCDLVLKTVVTEQERPFTAPGPVDSLPAFETPAGRLGVLVCADCWYPGPYRRLRSLGVEWMLVPSAGVTIEEWRAPWRGYDGAATPDDVDPGDVGRLTEGDAWTRYALAARLAASGARCGLNVFSRGNLWNMGVMSGQAALVDGHSVQHGGAVGAGIYCLWLPA